jgi:hypothetical protein
VGGGNKLGGGNNCVCVCHLFEIVDANQIICYFSVLFIAVMPACHHICLKIFLPSKQTNTSLI